jgi:hypothetical protein
MRLGRELPSCLFVHGPSLHPPQLVSPSHTFLAAHRLLFWAPTDCFLTVPRPSLDRPLTACFLVLVVRCCRVLFWHTPAVRSLPMLRLHPSELTLTSDDIEETFRRMARRQKPIAPVHPTTRPLTQPGQPVLRRGPQRSVRDAYRTLGNIPTLRPQSLQVIHTSADEDLDADQDSESAAVEARELRVDSGPGSPATSPVQRTPVTIRDLQLPIRLRHSPARNVESMRVAHTDIFEDPDGSESVLSRTPILGTPEGPDIVSASPFSSDVEHSDMPIHGLARLRGGGGKHRESTTDRDVPHTPSPLNRGRGGAPSRQQQDCSQSPETEPRTVYLQGYFTIGAESTPYHFIETSPWPRTEPCRRTVRRSIPRSASAGSIPVFPLPTQGLSNSNASRELPWNASPSDGRPSPRRASVSHLYRRADSSSSSSPCSTIPNQTSDSSVAATERDAEPRRFGSGTSDASLAYSYYELPDRSSSGDQFQPQYDGGAGSRLPTQGVYQSIRASEIRPRHDLLRPPSSTCPSHSSPNLSAVAHHVVSPLPLSPYERNPILQGPQTSLQTSNALETRVDETERDAASTAIQNEPSPLDLLADQLSRMVGGEDGRLTPTLRPFLHQDMITAEQRRRLMIADRQAEQTDMAHQRSGLTSSSWGNRPHRIEDDPYARGSTAHRQLQQLPSGSSPAYRRRSNRRSRNTAQSRSNPQRLLPSPVEAGDALDHVGGQPRARQSERGHSRYLNLAFTTII